MRSLVYRIKWYRLCCMHFCKVSYVYFNYINYVVIYVWVLLFGLISYSFFWGEAKYYLLRVVAPAQYITNTEMINNIVQLRLRLIVLFVYSTCLPAGRSAFDVN